MDDPIKFWSQYTLMWVPFGLLGFGQNGNYVLRFYDWFS